MDIRRTKTRQLILRTVKFASGPMTASQVHQAMKKHDPDIGRATVYRNLEFFLKRGEIYQLEGEKGVTQYLGHTSHDATFHCQRCGKTRQLKSTSLPQYVDRKMFGDQTIFISKLSAQGLCASCAKKLKKK